jgi:hypothetical protein
MKIGIITFHCANNYGALLQTFALYYKLIDILPSDEIYIVNYCPDSITEVYSLLRFRISFSLLSSIFQLPFSIKRKLNFCKFRKARFNLLSVKNISCLDFLICGSDQIWNPAITRGIDPYYFGIIEGFRGRTIAYAASDGGNLEKANPDIINKYLSTFTSISVREGDMLLLLGNYNKTIGVVLDPVFLPDISFWHTFASKQRYANYVLIYKLSKNDEMSKNAYQFAEKMGKEVIEITYRFPYKQMFTKKHRILSSLSISDFISLFLYADYVFTNSFHGTAFSIIFNRLFYVYFINDKKSNRIEYLLNKLNLLERYVPFIDIDNAKNIDYQLINKIIAEKKEESLNFIRNAVSIQ